jgi:hypothetical protein
VNRLFMSLEFLKDGPDAKLVVGDVFDATTELENACRALTVIPNVREHVSAKEISNIADEVQRLPVARLSAFKISAKDFFKELMDKLAHIEVVEVSANEADMLSSVDHAGEPIIDIDDVLDPVRFRLHLATFQMIDRHLAYRQPNSFFTALSCALLLDHFPIALTPRERDAAAALDIRDCTVSYLTTNATSHFDLFDGLPIMECMLQRYVTSSDRAKLHTISGPTFVSSWPEYVEQMRLLTTAIDSIVVCVAALLFRTQIILLKSSAHLIINPDDGVRRVFLYVHEDEAFDTYSWLHHSDADNPCLPPDTHMYFQRNVSVECQPESLRFLSSASSRSRSPSSSSTPVSKKQAPAPAQSAAAAALASAPAPAVTAVRTQYPPLPELKSSSSVVQQHLSAARTSASQALADHNFCGMINPGVFCSFISLLQSWFYIKAFRNVVLKSKSQDVTLTELNCVFRSLQNRNFGIRGTDCSIEVHFLEFSVWFLCPTHIISELRFEVSMFHWVKFKESLLRS